MTRFLVPTLVLFFATNLARADEPKEQSKKDAGPLELKIVAKKDKHVFNAGGKTPKEYRALLEQIRDEIKKGKFEGKVPTPPAVDLVVQIRNTGKQDWVVFVGGDANKVTLTLKGPGVIDLNPPLAFTLEFRLPKEVRLAPGKHFEIPLKQLSDGHRGVSRNLYWTEPGEYTLSAAYQLAMPDGEPGPVLTSAAVKLKGMEK